MKILKSIVLISFLIILVGCRERPAKFRVDSDNDLDTYWTNEIVFDGECVVFTTTHNVHKRICKAYKISK